LKKKEVIEEKKEVVEEKKHVVREMDKRLEEFMGETIEEKKVIQVVEEKEKEKEKVIEEKQVIVEEKQIIVEEKIIEKPKSEDLPIVESKIEEEPIKKLSKIEDDDFFQTMPQPIPKKNVEQDIDDLFN